MQSDDLAQFTNVSKIILEKKEPLKGRYARCNQAKFMNKKLQKAIMNRSRLLNKYKKEKTGATRYAYKRRRIFFCETMKEDQKGVLQLPQSRNQEKENYRPVSILPNLSKIFERCMYDQLKDYLDKILSKYQCGFRKGFSTQHCLLAMIEKL